MNGINPNGSAMPPADPIEQSRSILNPTDAVAMVQQGKISPKMTVREVFANLGVDVDGPATQLMELAMREREKAQPMNKMRQFAQMSPAEAPATPPAAEPRTGDLDALLAKLR
jgi:membrane protease subunit (stomatin/prohibitin family)